MWGAATERRSDEATEGEAVPGWREGEGGGLGFAYAGSRPNAFAAVAELQLQVVERGGVDPCPPLVSVIARAGLELLEEA
ncbi:MAG: hypothetical protein PVI86_17930 [Phycisphaerae bacterium]|jgi:hypothetical protein